MAQWFAKSAGSTARTGENKRTPEGSRLSGGFPCCTNFTRPTGALDTKSSGQVLKLVEKMNGQYGTTVVIITHNEAIAGMADRIIRLKDGQICENCGNVQKIPAAKLVL